MEGNAVVRCEFGHVDDGRRADSSTRFPGASRDDVTVPQMAPFFVIKVFVFHVTVRLLPFIGSVLLSSDYSGTTAEDRAFIVLYSLVHVPVFIFSTILVIFNNIRLAAWTSFPVCLTEGYVVSIMAEYILKLVFERLRGWLWNSEGNVDVLFVVSTSVRNETSC
jgi:hypothetical protein